MWIRILTSCIPKENLFLFGPRQVGKTTILDQIPAVLRLNLLTPENQLQYLKDPERLKREVEQLAPRLSEPSVAIIDEVQRAAPLLDIVQECIGKFPNLKWLMSGSSARKLKQGHANLLGGRALYRTLHPLTLSELGDDFRLDLLLQYGSLPKIYSHLLAGQTELAADFLRSYVVTYLNEEIKGESIVRNLQGFQNFLEVAAAQFSEQINFSELSRETKVSYQSAREYYNILEDTFIGFFLLPYLKSKRKRMSHAPKFYFFDNGVTRALIGALRASPTPKEKGRLFEQWVIQEVWRMGHYGAKDWKLSFWRTAHGAEVDLLIERGREIVFAVEIKCKALSADDVSGIMAFKQSGFQDVPCCIVAPVEKPQMLNGVEVLPPVLFLKRLEAL